VAFLRKHRAQYWLVHNFRAGGKVQQVRLYPFDLYADLEHEIKQAQNVVASLYAGSIASTWVVPVRQQLEELQENMRCQQREQQRQQVHQQMMALVDTFDRLDISPEDHNQLIWACMAHLQRRLVRDGTEPQQPIAHDRRTTTNTLLSDAGSPGESPPQTLEIGKGFCLLNNALYHACMPEQEPLSLIGIEQQKPQRQTLSPVTWVSLIHGRDLWLECQTCHTQWEDLSSLARLSTLHMHRQHISKFDRFCIERKVGDSCYILRHHGSGRTDRFCGVIQEIDYPSKKVRVASIQGHPPKSYWRHFANVYFGVLEVELNDAQREQVVSAGQGELTHLVHTWHALADTPETRLLLKRIGVRY
jgi:hypothetical protein